ncbi:unnamed protein product [Euphydryas editha]|uniref:Uncharacterized protein n=1 Tax=Euphydryas editha TaxID=104508 RepID=A0AAU9U2R5_EUPED|nr:unnamed protein product [Euphydryas editha]
MDNRLYDTKLANHKIFKDLKESLKENDGDKLRNLFVLKDDVLYVWNSLENCFFCINLKRLEEHDDETPYQIEGNHLSAPNNNYIFKIRCPYKYCTGLV